MKREQVKDFIPLLEAWSGGKPLQSRSGDTWHDFLPTSNASFRKDPSEYRIKPEPKLRPWTLSEVPVGALLRRKSEHYERFVIISVNCRKVWFSCHLEGYTTQAALDVFEHSTDGGETWLPCGVLEVA